MYRAGYNSLMKEAKRSAVVRFLTEQGYQVGRERGPHTWFTKPGERSIPLPRHTRISLGVLRDIEKTIGFVPEEWK